MTKKQDSESKLDDRGYNEFGTLFCECKPFDGPHPYEPGEWCSPTHVMPEKRRQGQALRDRFKEDHWPR